MNRRSIVEQVLVRMDEISPFDNNQAIQGFPVDKFLNQAAIDLLFLLPPTAITCQVSVTTEPTESSETEGMAYLDMPPDYLKLAKVRLTEWLRPVHETIAESSHEYNLQHNKYTRGGIAKPVVAEVVVGNERRLELYSFKNEAKLSHCSYIPKKLPEELPEELIAPLVWVTVANCYTAMEQPASSEIAIAKLNEHIELRRWK